MSPLKKLDLPWEVITLIGLEKLSPECLHLYNAILYGLAERYTEHGLEWVREHAHEIRTQICAAARYAGKDICSGRTECSFWDAACADASARMDDNEPGRATPATCPASQNTGDAVE